MRNRFTMLSLALLSVIVFSLGRVTAQQPPADASQAALSTAFTYQGRLMDGNLPADGSYPMIFRLFASASGDDQIGSDIAQEVIVADGFFTTQLDFDVAAFTGDARWLEISVNGTALTPRQALTAAPYALYAPQAGAATTAQTATLALSADAVPWSGISGVPADLADGDDVGPANLAWTDILSRPAGLDDGDDNTTYSAGSGLRLDGSQFSVNTDTIQLRVTEPCGPGSSIRAINGDGSVACETDDDTLYSFGEGLEETAGVVAVDFDTAQLRVSNTCLAGSSIRAINADGSVDCETDNDTTYNAGTGLSLSGSQFSVDTNTIQQRVGGSCGTGTSIRVINENGTVVCETDDNNTYSAGAGLVLNGDQFAAQGSPYENVVVVAKSGGDFTSVQAAIDSIINASSSYRYLVYVAPGLYLEQVTLKPYVALEGAGEDLTIIRGSGGSESPAVGGGSATITGATGASIRNLRVESNAGGTGNPYAVALHTNGSPRVEHVTASAHNASVTYGMFNTSALDISNLTVYAYGASNTNYGIYNSSASPHMSNIVVDTGGNVGTSTSYGIYNSNASPTMLNVSASANNSPGNNYGIVNTASSRPLMQGVAATATGGFNAYGIYNSASTPTLINVKVFVAGATSSGYGIYNTNSSPRISSADLSVIGGSTTYGIYNSNSSPNISDISIRAAVASSSNRGIYNVSGSAPIINGATIEVSNGSHTYGILSSDSSPEISNVRISAGAGSSGNYGMYSSGSSMVSLSNASASASGISNYSVFRTTTATVRVANSELNGSISTGVTCLNNYNASFAPVSCP